MPSTKNAHGNSSQFNQKLKNFFRINSFASNSPGSSSNAGHSTSSAAHHNSSNNNSHAALGSSSFSSQHHLDNSSNSTKGGTFRSTRFFSSTVGRLRSQTVASEGNPLEDTISPTAHANPYFAHQGLPGLRHRNEGSVPPSPPDTPDIKVNGGAGAIIDQPTAATKEELARKLRRVASAPNAQGLFAKGKGSGERPATAELGKDPLLVSKDSGHLGLVDGKPAATAAGAAGDAARNRSMSIQDNDTLGALPPATTRTPATFRRTYSSNSIKIRDVEVGPQSFDKIKLIGKGDVGKVYLVREKKSSRLYAMKGMLFVLCPLLRWKQNFIDSTPYYTITCPIANHLESQC